MTDAQRQTFASEEEGAGYAAPLVDLCAAGFLMALAGWYTWQAFGWRSPGDWTTSPALMPVATGITLMLMAGGLGVAAWRRFGRSAAAETSAGPEDSITNAGRTILLVAVTLAYLFGLGAIPAAYSGYVGAVYVVVGSFETSTVAALSVIMKLFWRGPLWACVMISLGWTTFLSLIFRNIFQIPLP